VLHNRAFVYRKLGEYSKAIGDYSKVRRSRRRCGQPAVAAQMWMATADDRADGAFACLLLGCAARPRGSDHSKAFGGQVLALAPRNTKTLNHRAYAAPHLHRD
jgi:hypothetical protein